MSLEIGFGHVRGDDGSVYFRYSDPADEGYYTYDSFDTFCDVMRRRNGNIEVGIREPLMAYKFCFEVYEKPF